MAISKASHLTSLLTRATTLNEDIELLFVCNIVPYAFVK